MRKFTLLLIVLMAGALVAQVYNPYPGKLVPNGGSNSVSGTFGAAACFNGSTSVGDCTPGDGVTIAAGTIAVDGSTVAKYSTGAGAPSAVCTAGREFYLDTTADVIHSCYATDSWKRIGGDVFVGTDSGGDDTYTPTVAGFPAAYATGQALIFRATTANTGAATINVNSIGAKAVKVADGSTDPANSDITAGKPAVLVYDATADSSNGAWILQVAGGSSSGHYQIIATPNDAITTSGTPTTEYLQASGTQTFGGTETSKQTVMAEAGTVTVAYLRTTTTQDASGSIVCTLRKNAADETGIEITVAAGAAAGNFSDTGSVAFVAGDRLGWKCVNNATTGAANAINNISIKVTY